MDSFFQDINICIFKSWIENLSFKEIQIEEKSDVIYFKKKDFLGTTAFYRDYLIEHEIFDNSNKERLYYMHYQFINFKQALIIFNDFINTFKDYYQPRLTKVLLCCSAGYTSTYFADGMKRFCNLAKIPIEIEAASYNNIDKMARQYDMVLLAPQIAYLESKILTKFNGDVYSIPPKMFATNDYNEIVEFILKHNKFTILNK